MLRRKLNLPFRSNEIPVVEEKTHSDDCEANIVATGSNPSYELASKEAGTSTKQLSDDEFVTAGFQHGVQSAQAVNQVWTKRDLILAYVFIYLIATFQALCSNVTYTLTPYVTSAFKEHSLTATTSIVSTIIAGIWKLPYAKIIDIWGRPQGFALMAGGSMTLGLIMMAGCNDVKTYCAAQVFYSVGANGIDFSTTIFIADTTHLKNRAFMIAYSSSPYLFITWAAGPAAEAILNTIGFRWGFGIWAIVVPITCSPLFAIFYLNQKKAEKLGLIPKVDSGRTTMESVAFYAREFDVVGLLMFATGLALFLLSFDLEPKQPGGWASPLAICFLVFGFLLIVGFVVWERYFAPVCFVSWSLIKDRTVLFTYIMAASLYAAWYVWDSYFYSFCIVVWNLSVTKANYIGNIYTIGSCLWALVMGVVIRYQGRLKWTALYFGVPVTILGVGLMIHFRQPDMNIGYAVMSQIFIAFGGGTLVMCEQMTIMAVSTQQNIPAVLAIESMVISIASSVGVTVAGAMWQNIFPAKLAAYLPADAQADLADIYGSITVQSSYAVGSPTRDAINRSYGDTQRLMLITATCLYSVTLVSTMFWRDVNVKNMKQVKGLVI